MPVSKVGGLKSPLKPLCTDGADEEGVNLVCPKRHSQRSAAPVALRGMVLHRRPYTGAGFSLDR